MFKKGIVLFVGLLFILLVAGCEKAGEVSLQQI